MVIGSLAYTLNKYQAYNRTEEMKNTPAGKMTVKADAHKTERKTHNTKRAA